MAKITVTTDDGVVVNVWRDHDRTLVDADTVLPEPNADSAAELRTWKFWVEDLLNEVRVARAQDAADRNEPIPALRTDLAQVERDRAVAQELIDLLDETRLASSDKDDDRMATMEEVEAWERLRGFRS